MNTHPHSRRVSSVGSFCWRKQAYSAGRSHQKKTSCLVVGRAQAALFENSSTCLEANLYFPCATSPSRVKLGAGSGFRILKKDSCGSHILKVGLLPSASPKTDPSQSHQPNENQLPQTSRKPSRVLRNTRTEGLAMASRNWTWCAGSKATRSASHGKSRDMCGFQAWRFATGSPSVFLPLAT